MYLHFFNPVAMMQLVEVVKGEKTSDEVENAALAFVTKIGKFPVPVKSSPGFLVNRVLMPYLMEAMTLLDEGVDKIDIEVLYVPGSFELVYGSKYLQNKNYDAVIAIGSVIRGETKHFDFICNATSQGIKDLNISGNCPVIFCVLTDDNIQQSIDRSGGKYGNKGTEAAIAAIEMALI